MRFEQRSNHYYYWQYTDSQKKTSGKTYFRIWLCVMVLVYLVLGIVLLADKSLSRDMNIVILVALILGLFMAIPFVVLWLQDRRGKPIYAYEATETVFRLTGSVSGKKDSTGTCFDRATALTRCTDRNAIIIKTGDSPFTIYADAEDYDAVWNLFVTRCPNARITEPLSGGQFDVLMENDDTTGEQKITDERAGSIDALKSATPSGKKRDISQVFFYLGAVFLLITLGIAIACGTRGVQLGQFSGTGQASILSIERVQRFTINRGGEYRYKVTVMITDGATSFMGCQTRYSINGWHRGDIVPVIYNVENHDEFVLDTTPEAYTRLFRVSGIIGLLLLLGGVGFIFWGIRLRRSGTEMTANEQ